MKRSEALRPLSSDHHHALVLCRRAREAATQGSPALAREVWIAVVDNFRTDMAPHFAAEESELLPLLEEAGWSELAARAQREHDALCRLMVEVAGHDPRPLLALFADQMEAHIRFEERELFSRIEQLPAETLQRMSAALQAHPISVRPSRRMVPRVS